MLWTGWLKRKVPCCINVTYLYDAETLLVPINVCNTILFTLPPFPCSTPTIPAPMPAPNAHCGMHALLNLHGMLHVVKA
jgi:hypothetical protein